MNLSIELSNGDYVVATQHAIESVPAGTSNDLTLQLLGPDLTALVAQDVNATDDWIGLAPLSTGGFTFYWQDPSTGVIAAQDYSPQLDTEGSAYTVSRPPAAALQAFSSAASLNSEPTFLNDNGTASILVAPNGALVIEKTGANGAAVGSPYIIGPQSGETFTNLRVAPTAETGGYVAAWIEQYSGNGSINQFVDFAQFSGSGQLETSGVSASQSGRSTVITGLEVVGLPDGDFLVGFNFSWGPFNVIEWNAQGQEVASHEGEGTLRGIVALPDGRYEVNFTSSGYNLTQVFTEHGTAVATADPSPQITSAGHEDLALAASATLTASAGWAQDQGQAVVLSNGALVVVEAQAGGYGSHTAAEQTYDSSGNETASAALQGYASAGQTLAPEVTASAVGGFYEVSYANSSDYEVYNANNQRVFVHNQYTSPTASFSGLANGGYITTDSGSGVFGLYDVNNNNIGWIGLPSDAPGAPTVNALNGGGFVFTYAGTNHFDLYDASGAILAHGDLSATGSQFAQGFASLAGNGNGFLEAWISPDGSNYNGVAASLDIQAIGPAGAITPAITITQDLDPWHTQFNLQAHADGSVAVLWSEGGAVFGAEYANGATGPAFSAGQLGGDLAHTVAVEMPGDMEGFAWISSGQAWAEIFNLATGQVQSADLGSASNADIHALATAQGGLAVSWHQNAVTGAVLDASGQVGDLTNLLGDFLGVNAAGQAVTLHENGLGAPVLQAYTLNDGAFWVH